MAVSYISTGHGPALVASAVVPLAVTWMFSSTRIYVRWIMLKIWKVEDWLFVSSQLLFSMLTICALMAAIHGNGQHFKDISPADVTSAMQYWYAAELLYTLTTLTIRLSLGIYLLRLLSTGTTSTKLYKRTILTTLILMSSLTVIYFVLMIFQCRPISYFWTRFSGSQLQIAIGDPKGTCFENHDIANLTIGFSVLAVLTDILFAVLPICFIWKLQMNPRTKAIACSLLGLGILAGLTVIIRMYYIHAVNLTEDFLFATSNVSIWSMIEPAIGIICMAASTFRPLFKSLSEKISSASKSRTQILKTMDEGKEGRGHSRSGSAFEDGLNEGTVECTVEGPKGRRRSRAWENMGEGEVDWKEGIMYTTRVEIKRTKSTKENGEV